MKLIRFKNIVAIAIVFGLLGVAFWVSQIPFREGEPAASPAPSSSQASAPMPQKPIFVSITSPTNRIIGVPEIRLMGSFVGEVFKIDYDVANTGGCLTNQGNYSISWNPELKDTATNSFECRRISLAKGTNAITLHTYFADGRILTNRATYVLDYSSFTNPPEIKILWPSNETRIAGSDFTLQAQVADPTITIHVLVSNQKTPTLEFNDAFMDDTGRVTVKDLPLGAGTNEIKVVAKDAAGNSSTTNINIIQSPVKITMRPIHPDQITRQYATVSGWISNPGLTVWVNGRQASVSTNGEWTADDVTFTRTRSAISPETGSFRMGMGFRPGATIYFTISAFDGKTMVATQRFEPDL